MVMKRGVGAVQQRLRAIKDWMESFADKPYAMSALFVIALAEASFFPIPPDVLLIAIAAVAPARALPAAFWCTAGSALGGLFGYWIGAALMGGIGHSIVEFYQAEHHWQTVVAAYQGDFGIWFLAIAAFTPVPYKIATIAAGATGMPLIPFVLVSVIGRGARFFLVGGLLYLAGPRVRIFIDKHFDRLSIAFVLLLVGGVAAIKFF